MVKARFFSRRDVWLFGIPILVLVLLPLAGWLAVCATTRDGILPEPMWFVLCGVIFWGSVPGPLFREPFFDAEIIG
jgi:hypothetical protein